MRQLMLLLSISLLCAVYTEAQRLENRTYSPWGIHTDRMTAICGESVAGLVSYPAGIESLRSGFIEILLASTAGASVNPEPEPTPDPDPEPIPDPDIPTAIEQVDAGSFIRTSKNLLEVGCIRPYTLRVYTVSGRLCVESVQRESHSVSLPDGVYFVILWDGRASREYKIYVP